MTQKSYFGTNPRKRDYFLHSTKKKEGTEQYHSRIWQKGPMHMLAFLSAALSKKKLNLF